MFFLDYNTYALYVQRTPDTVWVIPKTKLVLLFLNLVSFLPFHNYGWNWNRYIPKAQTLKEILPTPLNIPKIKMYEYKILKHYYVKSFYFSFPIPSQNILRPSLPRSWELLSARANRWRACLSARLTAQARSDCDRCVVQNVECATVTHLSSPRSLGKQETGAEATIPTGHDMPLESALVVQCCCLVALKNPTTTITQLLFGELALTSSSGGLGNYRSTVLLVTIELPVVRKAGW